ncbi:hypothetical protein [Arthrobacter crystallopoietes]|uniref:Uncharacterized protein n=1 Tax=Crystallibacter crystallopoietes TaxID=37928 RepID=A0A1H1HVE0_9MICC|nr:hypothetical protein [Arthrobacter crystallopoietes]SDR29421.1 hypothetical protein SAMN04489742_4699 [Arthrobacter crystallopoietes]
MGSDYQHPAAAIDYRQDTSALSAAEEQLRTFGSLGDAHLGPVDAAWINQIDGH